MKNFEFKCHFYPSSTEHWGAGSSTAGVKQFCRLGNWGGKLNVHAPANSLVSCLLCTGWAVKEYLWCSCQGSKPGNGLPDVLPNPATLPFGSKRTDIKVFFWEDEKFFFVFVWWFFLCLFGCCFGGFCVGGFLVFWGFFLGGEVCGFGVVFLSLIQSLIFFFPRELRELLTQPWQEMLYQYSIIAINLYLMTPVLQIMGKCSIKKGNSTFFSFAYLWMVWFTMGIKAEHKMAWRPI